MLPHFPNRKKLYIMNFILFFENLIIEKQGDLTLIIEKRLFDSEWPNIYVENCHSWT